MALRPAFLADKSAPARMPNATVRARLEPLLVDGLLASCWIIDLEIGFAAQTTCGPSRHPPRATDAASREDR